MYAQMTGINLGVIHGNGIWYSDPTAHHTSLVVYKGLYVFVPTEPGTVDYT